MRTVEHGESEIKEKEENHEPAPPSSEAKGPDNQEATPSAEKSNPAKTDPSQTSPPTKKTRLRKKGPSSKSSSPA